MKLRENFIKMRLYLGNAVRYAYAHVDSFQQLNSIAKLIPTVVAARLSAAKRIELSYFRCFNRIR